MQKYVFILGRNPQLSVAEIFSVLPYLAEVASTKHYLIAQLKEIDCERLLKRLGGVIKIGEVISIHLEPERLAQYLVSKQKSGKLHFGFSDYRSEYAKALSIKNHVDLKQLGMKIKGILRKQGISCRLVVSQDPILSSVVVTKNKCIEFIVADKNIIAVSCAIQDFEAYGMRDYERPRRDAKAGMLPPKLAQIMINLAQTKEDAVILDPFCGSGTILQEALLMGFKNIMGSDTSLKAIKDTKKNLEWMKTRYKMLEATYKLVHSDIKHLSKQIKLVDAIITEPHLGPALLGEENIEQFRHIILKVNIFYKTALFELSKILKKSGRMVIIFPLWRFRDHLMRLPIREKILDFGFKKINKNKLIYGRENQNVIREILILEKI